MLGEAPLAKSDLMTVQIHEKRTAHIKNRGGLSKLTRMERIWGEGGERELRRRLGRPRKILKKEKKGNEGPYHRSGKQRMFRGSKRKSIENKTKKDRDFPHRQKKEEDMVYLRVHRKEIKEKPR